MISFFISLPSPSPGVLDSHCHISETPQLFEMSLLTRYEFPLIFFLFTFKEQIYASCTIHNSLYVLQQLIIHRIYCSTATPLQEMWHQIPIRRTFMSCQGCIHFTRTAHLCLDICSLLRFVGKDSEGSLWGPTGTHETGIKDRASITTDVWYPCSVYKRNKFGNTVKCPRPISPGND